jgi:hypothetical protein
VYHHRYAKAQVTTFQAVHVIGGNGCAVEIQIRTRLQQAWAEVFEKFTKVCAPPTTGWLPGCPAVLAGWFGDSPS